MTPCTGCYVGTTTAWIWSRLNALKVVEIRVGLYIECTVDIGCINKGTSDNICVTLVHPSIDNCVPHNCWTPTILNWFYIASLFQTATRTTRIGLGKDLHAYPAGSIAISLATWLVYIGLLRHLGVKGLRMTTLTVFNSTPQLSKSYEISEKSDESWLPE